MKAQVFCGILPAVTVFAALSLNGAPLRAATIHVTNLAGNDLNDGLTWATARRTVQAGLNAAAAGDQVWVAAGTYVENVTLKSGVALYGGFAGWETELWQRNRAVNITVLDNGPSGRVTSPAGAAAATRIDGFTIRNGGGIDCAYSAPTIANNNITGSWRAGITCTYSSHQTIINNTITGNAGGISCSSSSPSIINNTITGNAGGISCYSSSSATIINNIIAFNSYGVYRSYSDSLPFRCNLVFGNIDYNYRSMTDPTGTNGNVSADPKLASLAFGNVHLQPDSPCRDAGDDSVIQPDWRDMDGQDRISGAHVDIGADESDGMTWPAGPYVVVRVSPDGDDANDGSSWALAKHTVQAGIDAAAAMGGEVWVQEGTYLERVNLRPHAYLYGGFDGRETQRHERNWASHRTVLDGNRSGTVVTAKGAGHGVTTVDGFTIRHGSQEGGIYCVSSSFPIVNNTIIANTGSAIDCDHCSPLIANNLIVGGHDGIRCYYGSPSIVNNTIGGNNGIGVGCANSSPTISNTIIASNGTAVSAYESGPILRHNCIYGNRTSGYSGLAANGNIWVDPRLASLAFGNVHLQPDSPCRDAGDDSAIQPGWLDMDGQDRISGAHVDIGADESDGTIWPGGPYVVVRVSPDGNDANDGSSWALAKRTVQAGIDAAAALGGEVWVQKGTYLERITLWPYAHAYGGFDGTETLRAERNWSRHLTILDGNKAGSVVTVLGGYLASALDGFTVRNGGAATYGGGIYCSYASPFISNNTVTANAALSLGGGIACSTSSARISHNTITGNSAFSGGGIYLSGSSAVLANNLVTANDASSRGGGFYYDGSSGSIINNTVVGNTAYAGGGIYYYDTGSTFFPAVVNTIVAFNTSGVQVNGYNSLSIRSACVYGNRDYNYSGLADPTGTNGNISSNPDFVLASPGPDGTWATGDEDYGDLRLLPGSPCIDAGRNADVPPDAANLDGDGDTTEPLPFDLLGAPRFSDDPATADTGQGGAPVVDIGACEYLCGDISGDAHVDVADLLTFANSWPKSAGDAGFDPACDLSRDGKIDVVDLLLLATNWGR